MNFKNLLAAITFLSLYSFATQAQGIRFGIRLDPQLNWYSTTGDIVSNTSNRIGFNGGLVIDKYFAENYALTTGISLSSVGGGITYNEPVVLTLSEEERVIEQNREIRYKLQYLELPFGLKLKSREFGYTTIFAQLGLTAQVNIQANVTSEQPGLGELDASDEINFLDMGYHFGGGVEYSLGENTALTFGLIFKNGFTDVTALGEDKVTLNTLALRIGIMF